MNTVIARLRDGAKQGVLMVTAIGLVWSVTPSAWARYNPPPPSRPPRTVVTTGPRGSCDASSTQAIVALAPTISHVGQTTALRPTLAWFVPETESYPLELYFYRYQADDTAEILYEDQLQSTSGIMTWTLPAEAPALEVGQRYGWQVRLQCNPNHPSLDQVINAELDVVAPDSSLTAGGEQPLDAIVRADRYAEAGIWYDALQIALTPATDPQTRTYRQTLLESLTELEREQASTPSQMNQVMQLEQLLRSGNY